MLNKAIAEDIKHTGWAIRDWLSPFYTLGGAVAFCITMLTLLDQNGELHLTRIVGAVLVICTFVAWALHLYKQHANRHHRRSVPAEPQAKLHLILFTVSCFFIVGILLSEAWMKNRRQDLPEKAPLVEKIDKAAKNPLPAPLNEILPAQTSGATSEVSTAPPPLQGTKKNMPASTPQAPKAVMETTLAPASAAEKTSPASAVNASATVPAAQQTSNTKPVQPKPTPSAVKTTAKPPITPEKPRSSESSASPKSSIYPEKCASLLNKFSLGEEVSAQEHRYLETSCR